jgi:hypothetical protein
MRSVEGILGRILAGSSRPDWTLLAVSYVLSTVVVLAMRTVFGAGE